VKVKLHKGPFHGKVMDVPESMLSSGLLLYRPRKTNMSWAEFANPDTLDRLVGGDVVTYEVVMMGVNIKNYNYTGPAMHPDGMIYMVYKK
jgi:hypothetical protein